MYKLPTYLRVLPALLLPLLALVVVNCNSSGTIPVGPVDATFTINGVVIKDAAVNRTTIAAHVLHGGNYDSTLVVVFSGDTLDFNASGFLVDSVYSKTFGTATYYSPGSHLLEISTNDQSVSFPIMLPDTFTIDTVSPPTPPGLTGPGIVNVDWYATPNVDGYVMAATKSNEAYSGEGYSAYAGFAGTEGSLPQAAFFIDTTVMNPQLDTGLWYLSVYGYNGAPDSMLTQMYLPVPMPSDLTNNIDTLGVMGSFGTVAVTPYEILQVSTQ